MNESKAEIGNAALLQAADRLLQILSPRGMPDRLDVGHGVQPVFDLATYSMAQERTWILSQDTASFGIGGAVSESRRPVGGSPAAFSANIPNAATQASPGGLDTRLLSLEYTVTFDAAGAAAFAGKLMVLQMLYHDTASGQPCGLMDLAPWVVVGAAQLNYRFSLWGYREARVTANQFGITGWPAYVPAEANLELILTSDDGTAFPANTFSALFVCALQGPRGRPLLY